MYHLVPPPLQQDIRSIQSSSLKWMSLPRLWKKRPQASAGDLQAIPVPDQLILDAQEIIAHHNNSTRPLTRLVNIGWYMYIHITWYYMYMLCLSDMQCLSCTMYICCMHTHTLFNTATQQTHTYMNVHAHSTHYCTTHTPSTDTHT